MVHYSRTLVFEEVYGRHCDIAREAGVTPMDEETLLRECILRGLFELRLEQRHREPTPHLPGMKPSPPAPQSGD